MSCHICGAPDGPDRICVTSKGKILCPQCFETFLKHEKEAAWKSASRGIAPKNQD